MNELVTHMKAVQGYMLVQAENHLLLSGIGVPNGFSLTGKNKMTSFAFHTRKGSLFNFSDNFVLYNGTVNY